jgi:DnaK suppressor protein
MQQQSNRKAAFSALRLALTAERARMASPKADTKQVLAAPQDVAIEDQVPLLHEQFVELTRHSRDRHTLGLIDAALDRLARDEYGNCEDCDGEISLKRLEAIPWASRCVPCQERFELLNDDSDLRLIA